MASFNPNDKNILKKPTLIRNITTGITRAGKELIRDYSPEAINIYDKNKKFIAENKGAFRVNASDINNNFVFKTGKQLLKNAMTELKTGNFYDKERKEAAMNDAMSAMMGVDLNGLFDDWDIDKDDNVIKSNVIEDTKKNSNAEIYNKTTTNLVTSNTSVKPAIKSISSMTKTFMEVTNKSFSSVNVQLNRRVEFESTSRVNYYNSAIENMSNLSKSLSIISSNMENLSNIEAGGLKVTTTMNQLSALIDSRELLTIDYYKSKLGKKELSDNITNPIISGIKNVMKLAIPKVMKNILDNTADIIKTFPLLLNQKFKNWSNDLTKPVKALAGSFLHKDPSKVNYSKGPVAWDGIARRSVVSVIPELLSKYYNIVRKGKSRDEMIYDYVEGGWRTARDVKRAAYNQYNDGIVNNDDINKLRMKAIQSISSKKPSDIRELNRTIRRLVEDKGMPSRNKKYSNNERINKAIMDAWLSMDGKSKSAFLVAVNSLMTPEEWISNNESFHSLSGIITSVDDLIDEKDEKKFKVAMHDYLVSKGNTKLANLFKDKKSSVNDMHKFNPFKYVAKGMEWLNASVLEIMLGDEKANKKSYNNELGKSIKNKMKSMFNDPFSEHINIIKETLKRNKNNDTDPLTGAGLGLSNASFDFITELGENIGTKTKDLKDKLMDKVFKPMIDLVRESIVKPMEKAFTKVGSAISNFFGSFSKFFNTYRDKRRKNNEESRANVSIDNPVDEKDNTFNEMKREEFKANKNSRIVNTEGKDRFNKIELLLISKNALLMSAIRNGLNKPVNNLKRSIKNIIESNGKLSKEKGINGNEIILFGNHLENISINMKKLSNMKSEDDINKVSPMEKFKDFMSKFKDKSKDKKESKAKEPKKTKERSTKKEDNEESIFSYFGNGVKARSKSIIDKWLYTDNFKEPPVTDKLKSLGFKIGDTANTMANTIVDSGTKITKDILHIKDNLIDTSKAFISSIPELGSKMFESASNVGRKLTNELKDIGKSSWNELKNQASRIWGGTKDIFSTGYSKLLGIFNNYKGGTFDVILDSGKLDGIRNIVKIVKTKKSSYEEMKDKFASESIDDAKDIAENLEDGNTSRSTIFKRIKDRAERMTNGIISKIKDMAKNGVQNIFNSLASSAGGIAGRFAGGLVGRGVNKVKGLIDKGKARTTKGKGNFGRIFGDAMDARNAMRVYIVGGSLDGGLVDGALDSIGNISDMLGKKKGSKSGKIKRVSKGSGTKLPKGKSLGKGAKKLKSASNFDTGIVALDAVTGAVGAVGDTATIFSKNSTKAEKIASGIGLADTAKDAYTAAKLGKTAITAAKGVKTAKNVAAGVSAATAGAGALAAGGSILATGGAILVPLAGAWLTDRVFKGLEGWGKAGEVFQTENPTLGMKVSSMAGSFLDAILPGDQSGWTKKIHSGAGKLKDNVVKGAKFLYKHSPIGIATGVVKDLISKDKEEGESLTDKTKSISGRVLQGKSSILTSLMALTNPIAYLSYKHMKKYRDFKSKENGLEKQFLSRLTPEEREEYLANKNASLFGALIRGNTGFKFIKTMLGSGILSLGEGISSEEGLTIDQAKNMISNIMSQAGVGAGAGSTDGSTGGSWNGGVALSGGDFVGRISAKYEVGEKGNGGFISTGAGDAGGKSYGISQFTSAGGGASANSFVSWLKTEYPSLGGYFANAGKAGSASFDNAWKQAYTADPTGFTAAQSRYTVENYVDPFNNKSKATLNLDWYRSRALQESAYSTAVQFGAGGAMQVAKKAGINGGMDDTTIVKKFYAEKRNSIGTYKFLGCSASVRNGVRNRFINEEKDILALIGQPPGSFGIGNSSAQPASNGSTPQTGRSITGRTTNGPSATTNLDKARKAASTNYTELNTIKTAIDNSPISDDDPSISLLTEMIALLADITDDTQEAAENTSVKQLDKNDKEAKSLLI